jgi:hypothetical protein
VDPRAGLDDVEVKVKIMFPFLIRHRALKACSGIEV